MQTNRCYSQYLPHNIRSNTRSCTCGRPAKFYSKARNRWRTNEDHYLCRQCWQSEVDAHRN